MGFEVSITGGSLHVDFFHESSNWGRRHASRALFDDGRFFLPHEIRLVFLEECRHSSNAQTSARGQEVPSPVHGSRRTVGRSILKFQVHGVHVSARVRLSVFLLREHADALVFLLLASARRRISPRWPVRR